jgi:ribosomal-protein-alanine N-acetyltransferase
VNRAPTGTLPGMQSLPGDVPAIRTERVELVSMSLAFMKALQAGDLEAAAREIGAALAPGMREDLANFLSYRIPDLEADPTAQRWLGRAIVLTHGDGRREVIGTIGFHAPPDETGRVEIGYRVEPGFRRRGIATECIRALLAWAEAQGIHRFRASVSPDNDASLAIIRSFGFHQVGVQMDEVDGEELVFHLDRPAADGASPA